MAATDGQTPSDQRSPISPRSAGNARAADLAVVAQIRHIGDDIAAYVARYPAAVELRTRVGAAVWARLERFRRGAATFAAQMRRLDREELAVNRDYLDECYLDRILAYVREHDGEFAELALVCLRHRLDGIIEEQAEADIGVQDSLSMTVMREMFLRRPSLWFLFNLYYPVRGLLGEPGRMNWVQLQDWAVRALQNPSLEPSVWRWVAGEESEPPIAVTDEGLMYNAALIEVYTDLAARFSEVDGA